MPKKQAELRWGVERRLEFIEFQLFWEGTLNRSDLVEKFGISIPQASNDLALYRSLAGKNLEYDGVRKRYFAGREFTPKFFLPNADSYLSQTRAFGEGIISLEDTLMRNVPSVALMPIPSRRVDPLILRSVLHALRDKRPLAIRYQSMSASSPKPEWRTVSPHSLASDGLRWHVRAYCHRDEGFRDFIISRCLAFDSTLRAASVVPPDTQWDTMFNLILVPNPKLSLSQRKTVALDYGMINMRVIVPVRHALLYYLDKRLRLDVAEFRDRPQETPVVVSNRSEYEKLLQQITQ